MSGSDGKVAPSGLQQQLAASTPFLPVRERDLVYMRSDGEAVLVVACDSDGAIGPKPHDVVRCSGYQLGRFAARVPLMEMFAAGAQPVLLVDTITVEMEPTGRDVIRGVLAEAALAGLDAEAVTGSTEDNVPTVATGVGVTVLGTAGTEQLRAGTGEMGCHVVLVGRPKSGPKDDFPHDHPEILSLPALQTLMALPGIRDTLPVGSHGVRHECETLARSAGLAFDSHPSWPVAPEQSGGPGTTCVAALDAAASTTDPGDIAAWISQEVGRPVWVLGRLVRP